jgi:surface antigen
MIRRHLLLSTIIVGAALALSGCKSVGSQIGSTVGSALGTTIGGGVATSTGSVVGGLLGGEIADALDPESQRLAKDATGEAITSGETQSWSNPAAGTSGEVQVVEQKQEQKTVEVQVLQDKVEDLPPVDLIGRTYVTTAEANVRGGPGTNYKVTSALQPGQTVNVVGKVQGKDWFMVSQADVIIGYVSTTLLTPATAPSAPPEIKPEGTVTKQAVSAEVTCRTAEHTVRLANGEMKTETVDACQTPDGNWDSSTRASSGGDGKNGTARPT